MAKKRKRTPRARKGETTPKAPKGEKAKPLPPPSKPPHRVHPEIWALLTPRQTVILELYLVHPNDKAIARLLNTADSTIRKHLSAIEQKAGVGSRAELLVFFLPPDR